MSLRDDVEKLRELWPQTEWSKMTWPEIWKELDELRHGPEGENERTDTDRTA